MNNLRRSNSCAVRALRLPRKKWNIGWHKRRNGNKSENSLSRSYKEGSHRTPATANLIKMGCGANQLSRMVLTVRLRTTSKVETLGRCKCQQSNNAEHML